MRAFLALALLVAASSASMLYSSVPAPHPWTVVGGPVNKKATLDMSVGLKRRNLAEMDKLFWEVSDPRNAKYGEHLGHEAMRKLISPGPVAVASVTAWLKKGGAKGMKVALHEDYVRFTATLEQIEELLGVNFVNYQHKRTKQVLPRALGRVTIPDVLANFVEVVSGHRGFPVPLPVKKVNQERHSRRSVAQTGRKNTIATGFLPPLGLNPNVNVTPAVLYSVYNMQTFPTTPVGHTNVQSFFQAQGQYVNNSDLSSFCKQMMGSQFNCHVDKYIGPNQPSQPGVESALDSEYISATSRGSETWVYSYANMDFCGDLMRWGQDVTSSTQHPWVISMSYGSQSLPNYCLGPDVERLSKDIQKMGLMGISVIIASGDSGSGEDSREGYNYGLLAPSMPASIPYCTAVGSTTFKAGNGGEQVATEQFGSGGGFSYDYAQPEYQQAAVAQYFRVAHPLPPSLSYNSSGRATPDVSALGEGYQVLEGGSYMGVGGTSCSTPVFAGMVTLLNNVRLAKGKTLGFLNPLLYQNPTAFTDIVGGNNDVNGDGYGWYAAPGWDPITGLGTPNFGKLVDVVRALP